MAEDDGIAAPGRDPERDLARALLVQACEESDPGAAFLSRRARGHAAAPDGRDPLELLNARARGLAERLEQRHPLLARARRATELRLPAWAVLLGTTLLALTADALGGGRRVNVLAMPLLGLLAWNAAAYLALAFSRRAQRPLALFLTRGLARLRLRDPLREATAGDREGAWLAASLRRFAELWADRAGALELARARRLLHLGALGFALGIVIGMYARGLAFEYRATWESTFLGPDSASRLLSIVLGPAALGLDALAPGLEPRALLDAEGLAALRAPNDGPAATWIHLWALTAAAGIGLPRAALALRETARVRRLRTELAPSLDTAYAQRLLAPARGEGQRIEVLPYSHVPSPAAWESVRMLLLDLFGGRAALDVRPAIDYGEDPSPRAGDAPQARVVLFSLAQTPEEEVHGELLERLREEGAARPRSPALLVLLDEEPYRRVAEESAARLEQRRRAWERIAVACGLAFAHVTPGRDEADESLEEARAALWTAAPGDAA